MWRMGLRELVSNQLEEQMEKKKQPIFAAKMPSTVRCLFPNSFFLRRLIFQKCLFFSPHHEMPLLQYWSGHPAISFRDLLNHLTILVMHSVILIQNFSYCSLKIISNMKVERVRIMGRTLIFYAQICQFWLLITLYPYISPLFFSVYKW